MPERKFLNIAVDMDSTLADMYRVVLPLLNFKHVGPHSTHLLKRRLAEEDIKTWDTLKELGLNDDFYAILDMFNDLNLRRAIPPTSPLAPAMVKWLVKRGHSVEVLTANPHNSEASMRAWLFGHGIDVTVHTLGRVHAAEKLETPPKYTILDEDLGSDVEYDLFVDDSPHLAEAIRTPAHAHQKLLLVTQPWNRHIEVGRQVVGLPDNVWRLSKWEDVFTLLEAMGA